MVQVAQAEQRVQTQTRYLLALLLLPGGRNSYSVKTVILSLCKKKKTNLDENEILHIGCVREPSLPRTKNEAAISV